MSARQFDNLCKYLSEKYPNSFASWLLGKPITVGEVIKSELSIEPMRADSVTFLRTQERILHIEFQVEVDTNPPLPLRMLDYWIRLHRRYRQPVTQVVILLKKPTKATVIETEFYLENTRHSYQVVRMWEQDPALFLEDTALLPLATLAATQEPEKLLTQISQQISNIESLEQRQDVAICTQLLAGLKFKKQLIRQFFREEIMQESVIYQDILQKGLQQGLQQGEITIVIRLLARQIGTIPDSVRSQLQVLPVPQLENLAEALLDFTSLRDLETWLEANLNS
ncbi:MAG: Rpn family recombination-promoting nuclease/putative transposase [Chroococcus sp. CMT-3BRIN-NPC107]|jgi:predicted transposase/invertase (TIGR01784 family)|nr:Rpn family recombination-promoting nuclease/putative transposase [Chroococcus sp. CMT-3BRIN-NPC107]